MNETPDNNQPLSRTIEAILFYKHEPVSFAELANITDAEKSGVREALDELQARLHDSGLTLVEKDDDVELVTDPSQSEVINEIYEEEINKDLTKAELETLTIVLYQGPVSKATIDYIRGVNSSTILRKVQVRGLVKKVKDPDSKRGVLYEATLETMKHLGITTQSDLPEYEEANEVLDEFADEDDDEKANPFVDNEE